MGALSRTANSVLSRLEHVGASRGDDDDMRLRKALLVLITVLILPVSLIWAGLYLAFGSWVGLVPLVYFSISVAAIALFARTKNFTQLLRIEQIDILLAPTLSMIPLGGFLAAGGVGLWGILAPIGALVFESARSGSKWFAAFVAIFLASGAIGAVLAPPPSVPAWFTNVMLALNVVVGGTTVFTLLALFAKQRQDAVAALKVEQAKADNLLLNILPRSIAERLKAQTATIADQFSEASILFADVVDFTPFAERLSAGEVVDVLNTLFSHFDMLAERYELEKIKTIGDSYMVAAGVPAPRRDHALVLCSMALDMIAAMESGDAVGKLGLSLRIGINSGPVVAGVIGRKRFLYDLWGDAVNVASRMESQGTAGRVQITRETYELVKDEFVCEQRGTVSVKGKGDMATWYLERRRAASV